MSLNPSYFPCNVPEEWSKEEGGRRRRGAGRPEESKGQQRKELSKEVLVLNSRRPFKGRSALGEELVTVNTNEADRTAYHMINGDWALVHRALDHEDPLEVVHHAPHGFECRGPSPSAHRGA